MTAAARAPRRAEALRTTEREAARPEPPRSDLPTALVTGASSGIGRELARRLAADGYALVVAARDGGRLEALAAELRGLGAPEVHVAPADLAAPDGVERLLAAVAMTGRRIDVLVNSAGFGTTGAFARTESTESLDMIQLNVAALTHLTRALLPDLIAAGPGRGRILNVASTAAFQPGPYMAVYYATKAFVLSFSEALAEELAADGVTVTALCPGPTATGFAERAGMRSAPLFGRGMVGDAASVAAAGYRAMRRGDRVVVPGLLNRLLVAAGRYAPRALSRGVVARLNRARSG